MEYQRARLWLGVTTVGSVVLASSASLAAKAPEYFARPEGDLFGWALFLLATVVFFAPFDALGGYILPRRFKQLTPSLGEYFRAWLRGIAAHTVILFLAGAAVMAAADWQGSLGALTAVACSSALLLLFQGRVARLVAHFAPLEPRQAKAVSEWRSHDPGFTGGILPFPQGTTVIPASWQTMLSGSSRQTLIDRRIGVARRGESLRGAGFAAVWNLGCFAAVMLWLQPDLTSAPGVVSQALGFTLLSFVGLLLLPTISRRAVYAADQALASTDSDAEKVATAIRAADAVDEQETNRSVELESIFHPIPCAVRRIANLRRGIRRRSGFWHIARYALYSSWACLGLLGRAVHCNCGRPALWVLLPAD